LPSGTFLGLPFAIEALQPLAWVAAIPFLFFLATERLGRGLLFTFLVGAAFIATGCYWLGTLSWLFMLICAAHYGLYFMPLALVPVVLRRAPGLPLWAYVPLLYVFSESTREVLCAFETTWWALGYTQVSALPLIQVAEWTGVGGVSLLVLLANAAFADLLLAWARRRGWRGMTGPGPTRRCLAAGTVLAAVLPFAASIGGKVRLDQVRASLEHGPSVLMVQGNISVEDKTHPDFGPWVLDRQMRVTRSGLHPRIDLVAWAETMPILPETPEGGEALREVASTLQKPLLLGALGVTVEEGVSRHANSAFLVSRNGEIQGRYDKQALVAFGEYVPFVERIDWLRLRIGRYLLGAYRGFDPFLRRGTDYVLFPLDHGGRTLRFAVLICYEDVLPAMTRVFARKGADFLLLISNENYFGIREMDQHVDMAVFRAVETRRPVLRVTNTGRTCVIDPPGRLTRRLERQVPGTLETAVPLSDLQPTSLAGPAIFGWLCGLLAAAIIGPAILRRRSPEG